MTDGHELSQILLCHLFAGVAVLLSGLDDVDLEAVALGRAHLGQVGPALHQFGGLGVSWDFK